MNTNVFTQNSAFYVMHNYTLCGVMLVKNEHIIAITLNTWHVYDLVAILLGCPLSSSKLSESSSTCGPSPTWKQWIVMSENMCKTSGAYYQIWNVGVCRGTLVRMTYLTPASDDGTLGTFAVSFCKCFNTTFYTATRQHTLNWTNHYVQSLM